MTDLTSLTLSEARDGLAKKSFTSCELTDAHIAAIEAARGLNAFVLETPDRARSMAREADARLAKGEGGPLGLGGQLQAEPAAAEEIDHLARRRRRIARCGTITPLGLPVEPEVYMM